MKKQDWNWLNLGRLLLAAGAVWLHPHLAGATVRTVTNLNDNGPGSLRDTITGSAANDTINFAVSGSIGLSSGEIPITHNLTVAATTGIIVDGLQANYRLFNISPNITVTISNLQFSSAYSPTDGGAIYNLGVTTINNCSFFRNRANAGNGGAINNGGTLTANNCSFYQNQDFGSGGGSTGGGGAINNSGILTVNSCSFTNNQATVINGASAGGAINNTGTLTVNNCLFSNNSSVGDSGSYGGAIATAGALTVNNTTFYQNSCGDDLYRGGLGGALFYNGSSLTIDNCTFSQNQCVSGYGGGIYFNWYGYGLRNTIVAGNSSGSGPDVYGSLSSGGHNFIGNKAGSSGWVASDLTGDPQLGPLHNNGGPTLSMLLAPTSPAIDAGDDSILSTLTTDQRGRPRKIGTQVDIGAVEMGRITIGVRNLLETGPYSLRQAILDASYVESDTIVFDPSVTGLITLTSGELLIDKSLSIIGPGANLLTVSGNAASRVFHVTNCPVLVANLRIADGYAAGGGGGIALESGGCITVSNCTITGCYAAGTDAFGTGGGAISAVGSASLTVIGSTLSSNSTPADGGGIYLFNGPTVSVINSTISGNRTLNGSGDGWGGGIFQINGGTLTVTACTIANNSSVSQGGGLYKGLGGSATIANTLIAGNSAAGGPDCKGTFVSSGYNLIGNSSFSTGFGQVGDQLNVDPLLGPLTDNGGPTFTHALLAGSPAIDKGKGFGLTTDQRGRQRPFDFPSISNASGGDSSDIGAYEVNPPILSIALAGSNVLLSWYTSDTGFTLEAKTSLSPAVLWTPVPGTPAIVGSQYVFTDGPATGNKFYRLRSP